MRQSRARLVLLLALTASVFVEVGSSAGAWTGPQPVEAGRATAVGDPFGGIHLATSTGSYLRWRSYDATGHLGPGHDLPMGASHDDLNPEVLGPVAWTGTGRALVSYANHLTVRNADGSWGPNTLTVGYGGSVAARDDEALIWDPASDTVHQFTIAADGTLAAGPSMSLTQTGDTNGTCGGGLTLDAAGNAALVYGAGLEVRKAVRSPAGAWTVSKLAQEYDGRFLCPKGRGQQGRLAVAWGEKSDAAGGVDAVKLASGSAAGGITVQTLASRTAMTGDELLQVGFEAGAGPDGSLFAAGGVTACHSSVPDGSIVVALAGAAQALGVGSPVLSANSTRYLDARDIYAPTVFGGTGLLGLRSFDASQASDTFCNNPNAVPTVIGDAFGLGALTPLYTHDESSSTDFTSAATDGTNGVITGTQHAAGGATTPVIWVQGTPGPGTRGTPDPGPGPGPPAPGSGGPNTGSPPATVGGTGSPPKPGGSTTPGGSSGGGSIATTLKRLSLGRKAKLSGSARVGARLRAKLPKFRQSKVKLSFRWYAGKKAIKKQTKSSLKLSPSLKGKRITLRITGRKTGYTSRTIVLGPTTKVKG